MKVARERKSSVLASNAVHHRIDSATGIVTLLVILGANLLQNAAWLDPIGGLLISLLVIKAGLTNTLSALYELADRSIDDDVKKAVRRHAARALAEMGGDGGGGDGGPTHGLGDVDVRDVVGVKSGQNYLVEVELVVPGAWTVDETRRVETAVRTRVGEKVRGVRKVKVRFQPREVEAAPVFDEFIPGDVSPRSSPEPEEEEEREEKGHAHEHHKHK
jgi:divalent metal cation (Fe/Co/Zn/Cd) transporter